MPVTGQTDPAALLMQRMGPAGAPGGAPAPPGGSPAGGAPGGMPGGFAGNAAGNPGGGAAPPQVNPQMVKLAQLAQRLLMQQQGTDQLKNFVLQIISMIKSVNASQFMQNPKASKRFSSAMESLSQGIGDLADASPNSGGQIQNAVMELMKPAMGPGGGQGGAPGSGPPQGPTPPAYPLG